MDTFNEIIEIVRHGLLDGVSVTLRWEEGNGYLYTLSNFQLDGGDATCYQKCEQDFDTGERCVSEFCGNFLRPLLKCIREVISVDHNLF